MAKSDLIGRFSLCGGGGVGELASKISGEKPPIVEIKKDDEKYSVSSLRKDEIPKNLDHVRNVRITKNEVDTMLFVSAEMINQRVGKKYIFKRFGTGGKLSYEVLRENL